MQVDIFLGLGWDSPAGTGTVSFEQTIVNAEEQAVVFDLPEDFAVTRGQVYSVRFEVVQGGASMATVSTAPEDAHCLLIGEVSYSMTEFK